MNLNRFMELLRKLYQIRDKIILYTSLVYIPIIAIMTGILVFLLLKKGFTYIGLENFVGIETILMLFLIVLLFGYFFTLRSTKGGNRFKETILNIFERKWFMLFVILVLIFFSFTPSILKIYPGQPDVGREYNDWFINYGHRNIPRGFSNVLIDSQESKYFVENMRFRVSFYFENGDYRLTSAKIIKKNFNESVLFEGVYPCYDSLCEAKNIKLDPKTERIEIVPQLINKTDSILEEPAIFVLYPDIIGEKEARDKEREKMIFLGSFISIILLTTAGFVNQLKQICNNKK